MRRALSGAALAAALVVPAPAAVAPAAAAADGPSATVNVCDTATAPGAVGVRVFAPRRRHGAQWALTGRLGARPPGCTGRCPAGVTRTAAGRS